MFSDSPDGKFVGVVSGHKRRLFWGGTEEWLVMKIEKKQSAKDPQPLRIFEREIHGALQNGASWNWRDFGEIEWGKNHDVIFRYSDPKLGYALSFQVKLPEQ